VKHFGIDGWNYLGSLAPTEHFQAQFDERIISTARDRIVTRTTVRTPRGDMWQETIYFAEDPSVVSRKFIKDLREDFGKLPYLFDDPSAMTDEPLREMTAAMGDMGVTALSVPIPGFQSLFKWFDGGLEAIMWAYTDHYDLVKELSHMQEEWAVRYIEKGLESKPDLVLLGASGLVTLQSPAIFRDLSLNCIKRITRMCKEAGVTSELHACGRLNGIVGMLAEETDLTALEPVEPPPGGDCDLAEVKARYGHRLALKGNLQTTDVMLLGSPADVERAAKWCIDVAAPGGGFVLSTGDQCGRDTPEANIRKLVEVAETYGRY
jgi:uroporphyrinogen decarboxylase